MIIETDVDIFGNDTDIKYEIDAQRLIKKIEVKKRCGSWVDVSGLIELRHVRGCIADHFDNYIQEDNA